MKALRRTPTFRYFGPVGAILAMAVMAPAHAWDAAGHRLIARLALEGMAARVGDSLPAWLREEPRRAMIADQSVTPDRWRNVKTPQLTHLNNPDHYLDVDQLEEFGLTLRTLPALRHEAVRVLHEARRGPGFTGKPVNARLDPVHVQEYPGFLPHATLENYAKIVSALRTVRIIERLNDPRRAHQLEMAKISAMYSMGIMAHYVGDASQPLHTTLHHHGWKGDNPKGYSTEYGIHAYIDGGVIRLHKIRDDDVRPFCKPPTASAANPTTTTPTTAPATPGNAGPAREGKGPPGLEAWETVLGELERSFAQVEPLYDLHKRGEFERDTGKKFIAERLADGADTLAALYAQAWEESTPSQKDIDDFVRYDGEVEVAK